MIDLNSIKAIQISLASPEKIREWSYGEVKKPETINYRTLKPERDGLFCERIFGPVKDFECHCGKYRRKRYKGVICDKCGVEVTKAKVRRERMGHIELATPVCHIWYVKGTPNIVSLLLGIPAKAIENVVYFASYLVLDVDKEKREYAIADLDARFQQTTDLIKSDPNYSDEKKQQLIEEEEKLYKKIRNRMWELTRFSTISEEEYRTLIPYVAKENIEYAEDEESQKQFLTLSIGAEAILKALKSLNLKEISKHLRSEIEKTTEMKKIKLIKRLEIVESFIKSGNKPEWMVLKVLPVLPPDLRPMVQLDGGRFATSDLNDLYRRVINRNNRLKRLLALGAPDIIVKNEKRMLQESVDALIDNGRRGKPVLASGNRPLKSLSDMLKGKQGRFRHNLLGKRVDYSGRSVIVVGPKLKFHQCGLPKEMALELFKPFVLRGIVSKGLAINIKAAKRLVTKTSKEVWDVLEEVIKGHPVLLNRAPTLHRLSVQAFEPVLVEGKAIKLHPLVCTPFNADFDGDQMGVHVPLSDAAQAEAKLILMSTQNLLLPAYGNPVNIPSLDMVLGLYYLTVDVNKEVDLKKVKSFASIEEVLTAYDRKLIKIHDKIKVLVEKKEGEVESIKEAMTKDIIKEYKDSYLILTTVGRVLFNENLPKELKIPYINITLDKKAVGKLVDLTFKAYKNLKTVTLLDTLKDIGFKYATLSGSTISMHDVHIPYKKKEIIKQAKQEDTYYEKRFINYYEKISNIKQLTETIYNILENKNNIISLNSYPSEKEKIYKLLNSNLIKDLKYTKEFYLLFYLLNDSLLPYLDNLKEKYKEVSDLFKEEELDNLFDKFYKEENGYIALKNLIKNLQIEALYTYKYIIKPYENINLIKDYQTAFKNIIKDYLKTKELTQLNKKSTIKGLKKVIKEYHNIISEKYKEAVDEVISISITKYFIQMHEKIHSIVKDLYNNLNKELYNDKKEINLDSVKELKNKLEEVLNNQDNSNEYIEFLELVKDYILKNIEDQITEIEQDLNKENKELISKLKYIITDKKSQKEFKDLIKDIITKDNIIQLIKESIENNSTIIQDILNSAKLNKVLYIDELLTLKKISTDASIDKDNLKSIISKLNNMQIIDIKILQDIKDKGQEIINSKKISYKNILKTIKNELISIIEKNYNKLFKEKAEKSKDRKDLVYILNTISGRSITKVDLITLNDIEEKLKNALYNKKVVFWTQIKDKISNMMFEEFDRLNPVYMMANSGARGNKQQVSQLGAMRGLMVNPSGDIVPLSINKNLREGLNVLEYFVSTHGARKGLADTALRTSISGYFTRRLIDVAQDIIITKEDCKTDNYIAVSAIYYNNEVLVSLSERISGRFAAEDIINPETKEVLVKRNEEITDKMAEKIEKLGIKEVKLRSPITCEAEEGVCQKCYGKDLATGRDVEIGEAIGIISAQSIGEPGTQLTLRTFHTGGVVGKDITQGLPRVIEILEVRKPKVLAVLSHIDGTITLEKKNNKIKKIKVINQETKQEHTYKVYPNAKVLVKDGDKIKKGEKLIDGVIDLTELLAIQGLRAVVKYVVDEIQTVYRTQGVNLNDKHIEVIIKQMLNRVEITDPGDTPYLYKQKVKKLELLRLNDKLEKEGKKPAEYKDIIIGITKSALNSDSFISAASFERTTSALTLAAVKGAKDYLKGLKENVIIGKLIPAGTGRDIYRKVEVKSKEELELNIEEDGQEAKPII